VKIAATAVPLDSPFTLHETVNQLIDSGQAVEAGGFTLHRTVKHLIDAGQKKTEKGSATKAGSKQVDCTLLSK